MNEKQINFGTRGKRRQFAWGVFAIGLILILGTNIFQPGTLEMLRSFTNSSQTPPEWMNQMEDIKRQDRLLIGLTPEMMESVKDNSPVNAAETRTVMKLWNRLKIMPLDEIRNASMGRVFFAQYLHQPGAYRGNVIRVFGTIRLAEFREVALQLRKNEPGTPANPETLANPETQVEEEFGYDFDSYYELWIQPDDNQAEPILVNVLEIPEGLPLGKDINIPIVIDGVFFKHYLYEGAESIRSAPMFYARAPLWVQERALSLQSANAAAGMENENKKDADSGTSGLASFIYVLGAALLLAGVFLCYVNQNIKVPQSQEPLPEKFVLPEVPQAPGSDPTQASVPTQKSTQKTDSSQKAGGE